MILKPVQNTLVSTLVFSNIDFYIESFLNNILYVNVYNCSKIIKQFANKILFLTHSLKRKSKINWRWPYCQSN